MSGTDKTGDKLVASIRKTKAGAAKKQAAPAKAAKPRKPRTSTPVAKSKRPAQVSADPYSCGGRVWPD